MTVYIIYLKEDYSFREPTLWVFQDKDKAYNLLNELNEEEENCADIVIESLSD